MEEMTQMGIYTYEAARAHAKNPDIEDTSSDFAKNMKKATNIATTTHGKLIDAYNIMVGQNMYLPAILQGAMNEEIAQQFVKDYRAFGIRSVSDLFNIDGTVKNDVFQRLQKEVDKRGSMEQKARIAEVTKRLAENPHAYISPMQLMPSVRSDGTIDFQSGIMPPELKEAAARIQASQRFQDMLNGKITNMDELVAANIELANYQKAEGKGELKDGTVQKLTEVLGQLENTLKAQQNSGVPTAQPHKCNGAK